MINTPSKNEPRRSRSDSTLSVGPVRSVALSLIHHPLLMAYVLSYASDQICFPPRCHLSGRQQLRKIDYTDPSLGWG